MSSLISKITSLFSSVVKTGLTTGACAILCGSMFAMAHGPGQEEIEKITGELAESGDSPELYKKRAYIFQDNQHWQEALADLNRAAQLDPSNAEYDLDRARLYYESGEYMSALDSIELYLLRGQYTTEALLIKGRTLLALEQRDEAIASYERALSDLSTIDGRPLPEWYVELADAQVLVDDKHGALQTLQNGVDTLGSLGVFQIMSAELEVELGDYDAALQRVEQLLAQSQRKDIWLSRKADILAAAGREEEAQKTYLQAYEALQRLPLRLRNLQVSKELAQTLEARIDIR